jgi:hypothetical protein
VILLETESLGSTGRSVLDWFARQIKDECVSTMCVVHVVDLTVSITCMVYVVLVVGTWGSVYMVYALLVC